MDDSRNLPQQQATGSGLTPNTASGLAYILGLITGVVFLVIEPRNERVRFHAMQSIILSVAYIVIEIALTILFGIFAIIPGIRVVFAFLGLIVFPLLGLVFFIAWLVTMIKAFTGSDFRLPIIAEYADKYSKTGTL
ncbi:MAG TPA: hypothetical protein VNL16_10270 [Chloroflexota bacterium]|nr:hypothetical protein [Chloroflexota bacterium]